MVAITAMVAIAAMVKLAAMADICSVRLQSAFFHTVARLLGVKQAAGRAHEEPPDPAPCRPDPPKSIKIEAVFCDITGVSSAYCPTEARGFARTAFAPG